MKKFIYLLSFLLAVVLCIEPTLTTIAASDALSEEMTITADIADTEAEYYVDLPQSISLGQITEDKDINVSFQVTVTMKNTNGGTLRVSMPSKGYFYLDGDSSKDALKYTNTFGTKDFKESTVVTAAIEVSAADVANVTKGNYFGSLTTTTSYYAAGEKVPAIEEAEDDLGVEKTVHFMKADDIGQVSMCDPLLYDTAYLLNNGDGTTTVSIYCIDPVPGFSDYGKPLGTLIACGSDDDVTVTGSKKIDYSLTTGTDSFASIASITEKVKTLHYEASGVYIPKSGEYDSDLIQFTVENRAIRNSQYGSLFAEVFVETVMQSWQKLYIVFDDVEDWSTGTSFVPSAIKGSTVSGLDSFAKNNPSYGNISMSITAFSKNNEAHVKGKAAIENLLEKKGYGRNTSYYSIDIYDDNNQAITDTKENVIELCIPFSCDSDKKISVYRAHGDNYDVTTFSSITARATSLDDYIDGTYYFDSDKDKLYIYSNKFSVYGIHLEDKSSSSSDTDDDDTDDADTGDTDTDDDDEDDISGTYTIPVTMKKSTDFSSNSMCNSLFYDYAIVTVNDATANVTLYVIDPIPNYQSYGTPISNIKVKYGSKSTTGVLNSSNQQGLYFAADTSFIPKAGYYKADPITFSVPYSYIEKSSSKTMLMQAYVNAVMKSTQSFYMVFNTSGMTKGSSLKASSTTEDLSQFEEATVDETTEDEKTTTTGLTNGSYQVKVGAKKANSDDASMMADYMYEYGDLTVNDDSCQLTIYIQHTVAGKENGGPKYIKYQGTEAVKKSNAKTISGVSYDSFTITTASPIPSILPIDMFINAMNMEVSCRLTVDTSSIGDSGSSGKSSKASSGSAAATSSEDTSGNETISQVIEDEAVAVSDKIGLTDENGKLKAKSVVLIVIIIIIAAGVLGVGGYSLYLRYKKRNSL